jgi:hypothetical protein
MQVTDIRIIAHITLFSQRSASTDNSNANGDTSSGEWESRTETTVLRPFSFGSDTVSGGAVSSPFSSIIRVISNGEMDVKLPLAPSTQCGVLLEISLPSSVVVSSQSLIKVQIDVEYVSSSMCCHLSLILIE